MPALLEYECPACGGGLEFDPLLQKVKCPYCESEFDVADLKGKDVPSAEQPRQEQMNTYICKSCGGEILCDDSTAATHCPYCDSPVVMKERLAGTLRPDLVIPFKLDKEAAKAALQKHISGKVLLPKCFKSENRIDRIQGMYVPFWLYDADTDADASFSATVVRHWSDRDYNYTQTKYYEVERAGSMLFEAVPVDASTKMANELMESIEPYDLSQAVDYQSAYLAGYIADKYDVQSDVTQSRAEERMREGAIDALRDTVSSSYTSVNLTTSNVNFTDIRIRYALLPVWILSTKYQGKDYTFAMNGQTGKMVGNLPMDKTAYWLWFAGISVIGTALAYLLGMLLR